MSELAKRLNDAKKDAMRAKAKDRLGVIRMAQAELKRVEVDERIELDDARVLAILDKMVKQRRDSANQFAEAGRQDLADQENFEISVLSDFLPTPLSDDELATLVEEAISASGAASMQDMGKVMGILKPKVQGRADMGAVSKTVKAKLG
ncbi:MAG: GatB/YqeY domain-containing protein [Cellvibrionaceae bacterium]